MNKFYKQVILLVEIDSTGSHLWLMIFTGPYFPLAADAFTIWPNQGAAETTTKVKVLDPKNINLSRKEMEWPW